MRINQSHDSPGMEFNKEKYAKKWKSFIFLLFFLFPLSCLHGFTGSAGTGKGYASEEIMRSNHPNVNLQVYESDEKDLIGQFTGEIDAYVGNLGTLNFIIQNKILYNLETSGHLDEADMSVLLMGIRKYLSEQAEAQIYQGKAIGNSTLEELGKEYLQALGRFDLSAIESISNRIERMFL